MITNKYRTRKRFEDDNIKIRSAKRIIIDEEYYKSKMIQLQSKLKLSYQKESSRMIYIDECK